ncbi:MAG: hypothetical protein IK058_03145 [Bacteroidales bacterium]|nr:hypothetical protein [Bacteroidales bacterium]
MFYTPKPRQFHYRPRFYDPEKERWEALKQKYADEHAADSSQLAVNSAAQDGEDELAYFERRVRELDRSKRKKLTWKDAFRKREMPKFNYQPRFASTAESDEQGIGEHLNTFKKRGAKIKRRFDVSDPDYMKPVPAGRIMLYALLVCALLYWILF